MRRMLRLTAGVAMLLGLISCGSTGDNEDQQVLTIQGFDDDNITQCDTFVGSNGEIDVQRDLCMMDMVEPFTDTFVNVNVQNNQKLDIILNSYTIVIEGASIGPYSFNTTQTAFGKTCSTDNTRQCATDAQCTVGTALGICQPSVTVIPLRLFDTNTKSRLIPDVVPLGRTFNVSITLFGSDVGSNNLSQWVVEGSLTASFNDFDNCDCTLSQ